MPHRLSARTDSRHLICAFAFAFVVVAPALPARAAEPVAFTIEMKDHKFSPAEIRVPASTPITLTVKNLDATAEEFESHPLDVEKVVAGNASATIRLKPLEKGSYKFVGEYHEDTAKGTLIVE
jgi:plastocyanin